MLNFYMIAMPIPTTIPISFLKLSINCFYVKDKNTSTRKRINTIFLTPKTV